MPIKFVHIPQPLHAMQGCWFKNQDSGLDMLLSSVAFSQSCLLLHSHKAQVLAPPPLSCVSCQMNTMAMSVISHQKLLERENVFIHSSATYVGRSIQRTVIFVGEAFVWDRKNGWLNAGFHDTFLGIITFWSTWCCFGGIVSQLGWVVFKLTRHLNTRHGACQNCVQSDCKWII